MFEVEVEIEREGMFVGTAEGVPFCNLGVFW